MSSRKNMMEIFPCSSMKPILLQLGAVYKHPSKYVCTANKMNQLFSPQLYISARCQASKALHVVATKGKLCSGKSRADFIAKVEMQPVEKLKFSIRL